MQVKRYDIEKYLLVVSFLALLVFSASVSGLASRARPVEQGEVESAAAADDEARRTDVGEANESKASTPRSPKVQRVEEACELISRGEFAAAAALIRKAQPADDSHFNRLLKLTEHYEAITERRGLERQEAYQKQLAELEKFRVPADANDANDANDITRVLSVIAQARDLADDAQREELLADAFVQQVFEGAKSRADELESEHKWLDSYISCYSWLQAIMPENQEYSDHGEKLLEKANIVASLQDSPCEKRQERYEKVEAQMFTKAVEALHFNYVNIVDYRQMAIKAIRRCQFLAEVMASLEEMKEDSSPPAEKKSSPDSVVGFGKLQRRAAWSAGLSAVLDEVNESATFTRDRFVSVFEKVVVLNGATVELPRHVLIAHFAEAAFSALDPYTVMVWPRQAPDFEKTMTNEFTGIGVEITKKKGLLTIVSLLPGTPAYNSGLDAQDIIEAVDGIATKDMSLTCAVRKITGPAGTEVKLSITRPGEDEKKDVLITRAKITVPTIRGWQRTEAGNWLYIVDDQSKIGYVRITSFSATTASDLEKVLDELEAAGLEGLILDLRFDTGGLLDSAVEVTDKFIDKGLIVRTQSSKLISTFASAHKEDTHPNYPLVVLVNRISASASEIVAGALQDKMHNRAVLVGERTQGKGSVQGITPYPGGGAQLKYTMAYYHLPSGQRVESQESAEKEGRKDWGLTPDIELFLRSDELRKLLSVQRDNDVLVQADSQERHTSLKKRTLEETLEADPQLEVGILVVKSKLVEDEVTRLAGAREAL